MQQVQIKKIPYQSTWSIRQKVMWPNQPMDYIKLQNDGEGLHFGLFIDDRLVSIVSAFVNQKEAQFRKFATLHDAQGKGYGTQLLTYLLNELVAKGVKKAWCNARADKVFFYERFGLKKTEKTFAKGDIDYIIMERYF